MFCRTRGALFFRSVVAKKSSVTRGVVGPEQVKIIPDGVLGKCFQVKEASDGTEHGRISRVGSTLSTTGK